MIKFKHLACWLCVFCICFLHTGTACAGDMAGFLYERALPQRLDRTRTEYAPWVSNFHLLTQEQKAAGKDGGRAAQRTYCIDRSPHDERYMLYGLDTSGMYMSNNGGESWFLVSEGIACQSYVDIAYDPMRSGVVYAIGVSALTISSYDSFDKVPISGLYRSDDNGWSWRLVRLGKVMVNGNMADDLIRFDQLGNLYVYFLEGVLRSTDQGHTWTNLGAACEAVPECVNCGFYVSQDGQMLLTTNSLDGLRVSFDGGATWQSRNPYPPEVINGAAVEAGEAPRYAVNLISIAVDPDDPAHWYVTSEAPHLGELYETTDCGISWIPRGRIDSGWKVPFSRLVFGDVAAGGKRRMFVSGTSANRSEKYSDDGGVTWQWIGCKDISGNVCCGSWASVPIYVNPQNPSEVWLGSGGEYGLAVSTDNGTTWTEKNAGFSGHCVRQFKFDKDGYLWGMVHDFAFYKTDAPFSVENWDDPTVQMWQHKVKRWNGAHTCGDLDVDPRNPNRIIAAIGKYGDMVVSETTDGGLSADSWNQFEETALGKVIRKVKFHDENPDLIYTSHFISRDNGRTWTATERDIRAVYERNNDVVAGIVDKTLYISKDTGLTWTEIPLPYGANSIAFDVEDPDILFLASSGAVMRVDHGVVTTYNNKNGLGIERLYQVAQNPFDRSHLLAGGTPYRPKWDVGVYESYDGGENWHIVHGFPGPGCTYSVAFSPTERVALVGSYMGTFLYDYDSYRAYYDEMQRIPMAAKYRTEEASVWVDLCISNPLTKQIPILQINDAKGGLQSLRIVDPTAQTKDGYSFALSSYEAALPSSHQLWFRVIDTLQLLQPVGRGILLTPPTEF